MSLVLRLALYTGTAAVLLTEFLSVFRRLDPVSVGFGWVGLIAIAGYFWGREARAVQPRLPASWTGRAAVVVVAGMAAPILVAAWWSPPNSADAMAYHLPRIVYWIQTATVAFFPTSYLNQISLSPVAEYLTLQTWLLSGGDHWVNLITTVAFVGSVFGVARIAGALGLDQKGQAYAALFCVTLPNGILQASGAKNDTLLGFWLVCFAYFAICWAQTESRRAAVWAGLALGLALGTKGTGYLFAPPVLLAALLCGSGDRRRRPLRVWAWAAASLLAGTLVINAPQYGRNFQLSGSILGFDSAHADGAYRWRNETLGWRSAVSNLLRNASEQLGARSETWNQQVYAAALRGHTLLGINPQDPASTWPHSEFRPPRNSNHEADSNNRWHVVILAVAVLSLLWLREWRWLLYAIAPLGGFAAFCFYLKWQPFLSRLQLPLFVLAAPLAAAWLVRLRPRPLALAVLVVLVMNTRLALFENWTRPLRGPGSILVKPREESYFNDMVQWNNAESYRQAVDWVAASRCGVVGIDLSRYHVEYPFQALLRARIPGVRFVHVGVLNPSTRYAPANPPKPCAVFCPDCAGVPGKVEQYAAVGPPRQTGTFLVFLAGS